MMFNIYFVGDIKDDEKNIFQSGFSMSNTMKEASIIVMKNPDFSSLKLGAGLLLIINLGEKIDSGALRALSGNGIVLLEYFHTEQILLKNANASLKKNQILEVMKKDALDYIKFGNINNSTNFPNVSIPANEDLYYKGDENKDSNAERQKQVNRGCIFTYQEPAPAKLGSALFADKNILKAEGGTEGEFGYAIVATYDMFTSVPQVPFVTKVRILQDI